MSLGRVIIRKAAYFSSALLLVAAALTALAQDVPRQTVAIAYPLDETITVKFRGTTLLPRLQLGQALRPGHLSSSVSVRRGHLSWRIHIPMWFGPSSQGVVDNSANQTKRQQHHRSK
jgi:hypothetical protein